MGIHGTSHAAPLWFNAIDDDASYEHVDDHFMVGDGILVRAVTKSLAKTHQVYLPPGKWFNFWNDSSSAKAGGRTIKFSLQATSIPVFVRQGQILFKKMRPRRSSHAMAVDPYTLFVYGAPAMGRVYIDDSQNHDFQKGAFI